MSKSSEAELSGDMGDDLMRACQNAQQINLNGHAYVIVFVDKTGDPALIKLKRFPSGDRVLSNNRLLAIGRGKDDKLIDLVREFRDSIGDGKITFFDRKKYIQTVINLAEGLPVSVVAEALDKAAEYVRNQKVAGHWNDNED